MSCPSGQASGALPSGSCRVVPFHAERAGGRSLRDLAAPQIAEARSAACRAPASLSPKSRPEVSAEFAARIGARNWLRFRMTRPRLGGFVFQLARRRMTGFVFSNDSATPGWVRFFKLFRAANMASFFQTARRRMTGFVFSNDSATPGWVRFFKLLCDANVASFFQLAGRRMRGFVFSNNSATRTWVRFFKIAPRRQIGFERAKSPTTNSTSRAAAYSASGSPESRSPSYRPSSAGSST